MDREQLQQHLSHINTMWTMLDQAHRGEPDEAAQARRALMQRYCGAVYRYLLAAVRNPTTAEELTQEFALRFLEGKFSGADRSRGPFRKYVKTALFNLVNDWRRRQGRQPPLVSLDAEEMAVPAPDEQEAEERAFRESWRQELLSRAWKGLESVEQATGQPFYSVLRCRVDGPDLSSSELAEALGRRLGKEYTSANARQLLHRARARFAEVLLEEVRQSLEGAGRAELEEELADLDLLKYCQPLLAD